MAKTPKKDINLYTLLITPKKNTMKKGALFAVIGAAAVVLLGGSFVGVKVYVSTQEKIAEDLEVKANDPVLQEKIANANAVAADIAVLRTAGDAYATVRHEIIQSQGYCDNFTDDLIEQIQSCQTYTVSDGGVEVAVITGLSCDGSTLSISAESPDSQYVSFFVRNLGQLGIFSDISYSGYSKSDTVYTYTVQAVFVNREYTEEETEETDTSTGETDTEVTP